MSVSWFPKGHTHGDPSRLAIELEGVGKTFRSRQGEVVALGDVSVSIREGEFFCIVGPSGCGKTTLLRILAGLEEHTTGRISMLRRDSTRPWNTMVFQEQSVFPWMTVYQNVAYGLRIRRLPKQERHEITETWIRKIGLQGFEKNYPHQLSGGMKQRVAIARAFANDPEFLLMDEPFANLDEQTKIVMQQELISLWESNRKTVVFITHSIDEAILLGDRIMMLTAHPGSVKGIYDVNFPRPREIADIRANPRFAELFTEIWGELRTEVQKARNHS